MKKKCVFLHGSYYAPNFGDHLLLYVAIKKLNRTVVLPFARHNAVRGLSGVCVGFFRNIFNCSSFVFGGGGYFGEPDTRKFRWSLMFVLRHFIPFLLMRVFGRKIYIIGVGVGPLTYGFVRLMVKIIFESSEVIALRDAESVEYAKAITDKKISLITDLAQDPKLIDDYISLASLKEYRLPLKYIAIHISKYMVPSEGDSEDLRLIFEKLHKLNYDFVFFVDSPSYDNFLLSNNLFYNLLPSGSRCHQVKFHSPFNVAHIIKNSSGLLTGKLHAGIVACTLGIPTLSFPSHSKTIRFYRQLALERFCSGNEQNSVAVDEFFDLVNNISSLNNMSVCYLYEKAERLLRDVS